MVTDSGVAAATTQVLFELCTDGTNMYWYINQSLVQTTALSATHMPASTAAFYPFFYADSNNATPPTSASPVSISHVDRETTL